MSSITIYIEGGGATAKEGQAALRQGFDRLLARQKAAARQRRLGWKVVLCGGRDQAWSGFRRAFSGPNAADVVGLLVDAEKAVADTSDAGRVQHLRARDKSWQLDPDHVGAVHLMIECMEAWLVADVAAVERYYGAGFAGSALPARKNLDQEPKASLSEALKRATAGTSKGSYAKVKHASALLGAVDPSVVAQRCPSFRSFVEWLEAAIAQA